MILRVQQGFISRKTTPNHMIVIGLLSTEEEAQELSYIAKICTIEERIHHIVYVDKIKKLAKQQNA